MKKWVLICFFLLCATPVGLYAQGCAMCTKTASELDPNSAKGLNKGIIYLAGLPLGILGVVGFFWWRQTRPKVESES
ncbi:MAG: hypothetical protein JST06_06080 [Bacteroidetes bacterium]|nr:hypothetical protein [Bacteroidota bacterium]MBS1630321.1 hypothetical protein [Bacteroidota bacterium]